MKSDAHALVDVSAAPRERFQLSRAGSVSSDFGADVKLGLTSSPKFLQPQYFYDGLGSSLFEAICRLPEYYVTRAETEILTTHAAAIIKAFDRPTRVIELGSGSARKTRILLDELVARQPRCEYVPVDVDEGMLATSGAELVAQYPSLQVSAVCADFRHPKVALADVLGDGGPSVVLFLGSSIGNLEPAEAVAMLSELRETLTPGDALFLGADLRKDAAILEAAYDDPVGVTASFNLNILGRINRELGGTFDLRSFSHRAFYDEALGRVEMHLVSKVGQTVRIDGYEVGFTAGESIHTENSHKYDSATLESLAEESGFTIDREWTDSDRRFVDVLLRAV